MKIARLFLILNIFLLCVGCSSRNSEIEGEEIKQAEEDVNDISNAELESILKSNMGELIEKQKFQINEDKDIRVFSSEYYYRAEGENTDFYLVCKSYYDKSQQPAYVVLNDEHVEGYLEKIGLSKEMTFSDIMNAWGNSDVFEMSYNDTVQKQYKIEYEREGLRFLFVSKNEEGEQFVLYIGLPKDGSEEEKYYPIPTDDEIKNCLNKTVQELEEITECEMEKMLSILSFPVLYSTNTSYWFVCSSWDKTSHPKYLVFYEECEEEYLRQLGLKNADNFSDIIEVMGDTEIVASRTGDEMEEIKNRIGDRTYYKMEYECNGLQYAFIADNAEGKDFTLYISLTDEMEISEELSDNSDAAQIMELYEDFLKGVRNVKGICNINDITIPVGETDIHYSTKYAYCDSNGDDIPELHIKSGRYYYIISYQDNDLFV